MSGFAANIHSTLDFATVSNENAIFIGSGKQILGELSVRSDRKVDVGFHRRRDNITIRKNLHLFWARERPQFELGM